MQLKISSLVIGVILVLFGIFFLIQTLSDELSIQTLGYPLMGISIVLMIGALLLKNGLQRKKENENVD